MTRYLIALEKAGANYSAYSPDVPGCIATGASVEETLSEMTMALRLHFEGLLADGEVVPEPHGVASYEEALELSGPGVLIAHVSPAELLPEAAAA